jgi:hypothetical protein
VRRHAGRDPRKTVLLFTKPPVAGRVKTRLIGALMPEQAAELHAAFLADLTERLSGQSFTLLPVWALERREAMPQEPPGGRRQAAGDLGERMRHAFTELLSVSGSDEEAGFAVAIGSDLPQLDPGRIDRAFAALTAGADVVLGPAVDGGYYLIGLGAGALRAPIFEEIAWSTDAVLRQTLERCRAAGLAVALLAEEEDIDTVDALERLAGRLAAGELPACPRTAGRLAAWGLDGGSAAGARLEGACAS